MVASSLGAGEVGSRMDHSGAPFAFDTHYNDTKLYLLYRVDIPVQALNLYFNGQYAILLPSQAYLVILSHQPSCVSSQPTCTSFLFRIPRFSGQACRAS